MKLTETTIKSIVVSDPNGKTFMDDDQPGFGIRVYPTGSKKWIYLARVHGKKQSRVIGDVALYTATRARGIAREIAGELRQGVDRYGIEKKRIREEKEAAAAKLREQLEPRLDDLVETYLAKSDLKPATDKFYRGLLNRPLKPYHNLRLRDIDSAKIAEMYDAMSKTNSPLQASKAIRLVKTIFLFNGKDNPVPYRMKMAKEGVRQARLEPLGGVDVWASVKRLPQSERTAFVGLLLLTGCRTCELTELTLGNVDLVAGHVTIPDTKNGSTHRVYLSSQAEEMLRSVVRNGHPDNKVFSSMFEARKVIPDATYSNHDFRKVWAITAMEVGVPYPVIKACLNHKSADVTLRHYAQATPSQMRKAWQDVADFYTTEKQ